ncbi:MAG: hypothetical protein AAF800_04215 [Planctomycetota bacterium]
MSRPTGSDPYRSIAAALALLLSAASAEAQVVTLPGTPLTADSSSVAIDLNGDGTTNLTLTHFAEDLSGPPDDVTGLFTLQLGQPAVVVAGSEVPAGGPGSPFDSTTKVTQLFAAGDAVDVAGTFSGTQVLGIHDVGGGFINAAAGPFASTVTGVYPFSQPLRTAYLGFALTDPPGTSLTGPQFNGYLQLALDPTTLAAEVVGWAVETTADTPITVVPIPEPATLVVWALAPFVAGRSGRARRSR